jgi:hypothetical protein
MRQYVNLFCVLGLTFVLASPVHPAQTAGGKHLSRFFYGWRIGVLGHDVDSLWSGSQAEEGVDLNAEIVLKRPGFSFLKGRVLPNVGMTVNTRGDTSTLYAGCIWEYVSDAGVFFNTGVGLAVHNGELETADDQKKSLGSRVLFRIPIELGATFGRRHRLSLFFAHISNAYLTEPNDGLDVLGLRYGWQF